MAVSKTKPQIRLFIVRPSFCLLGRSLARTTARSASSQGGIANRPGICRAGPAGRWHLRGLPILRPFLTHPVKQQNRNRPPIKTRRNPFLPSHVPSTGKFSSLILKSLVSRRSGGVPRFTGEVSTCRPRNSAEFTVFSLLFRRERFAGHCVHRQLVFSALNDCKSWSFSTAISMRCPITVPQESDRSWLSDSTTRSKASSVARAAQSPARLFGRTATAW